MSDVLARLGDHPVLAALDAEPGVHVVGGAVRDALLGRKPRELDLVVEGDAVALAARLGGAVIVHDRFGTATVRVGGVELDLAGTRTERYPEPGALPVLVALGVPLREDLARRDFSVNAMAVALADGSFTAWPGAEADLEAGVLRVLHERSFTDDPTRLLRMVRYAARLEFGVEPSTAALAREAIAGGAPATVSGERLGAELRRLLREPQPAALCVLGEWGLGAALLDPDFEPDPVLIERALALCPADARGDLAALAACLLDAPPRSLADRLARLAFPAGERDAIVRAASSAHPLARTIETSGAPSELWRALHRAPAEAVAVAGALADDDGEARARSWLGALRHVRPVITGHDLVAAGLSGRAVGDALEAAQLAAVDGRATTREEQLAAALDAVGGRRHEAGGAGAAP